MNKNQKKQNTLLSINERPVSLRYDESLERVVLGSLLLESTAINEVVEILKPDVFYKESNNIIYSAIESIYQEGGAVDMLKVTEKLARSGKLEEVGGPTYIAELTFSVSSTINIVDHARYLHEFWLSRRLYFTGMELAAWSLDKTKDVSDTLTEAIQKVEAICQETEYGGNFKSLSAIASGCIQSYEKRKEAAKNGYTSGITTGLSKLDSLTGGFRAGQLIILAARPGMGKTAMLLHMARCAASTGKRVLIFSLEMGAGSLIDRLILSLSGVNSEKYRNGELYPEEETAVCKAVDTISLLPIDVDGTANISIQQIKARARSRQVKQGCDIILIDYLQLIDMRNQNRSYNREQEVSQTSRACKIMAKELGVPVVLLSQLNRANENRADKTPLLSDLRESGAIEQDADIVLFVHRPECYDKKQEKGKGQLHIGKHREGRTGAIPFSYSEDLTRITDYGTNENLPF